MCASWGPAGRWERSLSEPSNAVPVGCQQGGGVAPGERRRQPAWVDEDDAEEQINIAGRARLRKLRQTEEEAVLTGVALTGLLRPGPKHARA